MTAAADCGHCAIQPEGLLSVFKPEGHLMR